MLNVKLKEDITNEIKFEDLEVGTIFIWKIADYNDKTNIGMKIVDCYEENSYVLDLSYDVGTYYKSDESIEIIRIIDNMELIEK